MNFLLCASLIHLANINSCSFTKPQGSLIVLCRLPCQSSSNKMSTVERMKCNYSLSWRGSSCAAEDTKQPWLKPEVTLCFKPEVILCYQTVPRLFLRAFISYAGFARGFGCRCVHFTSRACHVLTKGLWSSVGLTAWADAQGAKPEDL